MPVPVVDSSSAVVEDACPLRLEPSAAPGDPAYPFVDGTGLGACYSTSVVAEYAAVVEQPVVAWLVVAVASWPAAAEE